MLSGFSGFNREQRKNASIASLETFLQDHLTGLPKKWTVYFQLAKYISFFQSLEFSTSACILMLGIYPEKTIIQKDTCTPMSIAALFTIARTWKQPKGPSTNEWIKMWYIYTMEYYLAIKRNEIGSFVEAWMDLETVIQSEISQKEQNKYCILTHICGIRKNGADEPVCKAEIETQM